TDPDGSCQSDGRNGDRNGRSLGAGAGMGDLQWRSYVHVCGEFFRTEDTGAPSGAVLCGYLRGRRTGTDPAGYSGHAGQSGAAAAEGRCDLTEDGGSGRTLRTAWIFLVFSDEC